MSVWNSKESRTFGLTLAAFSALTVFLLMYAWVLTWISSNRVETTGFGYFTLVESLVMFVGPLLWLLLVVRLVYLTHRAAGTLRSLRKAPGQPS